MRTLNNEISVVGSLLIDPQVLDVISSILTPSDFESQLCKAIFVTALELQEQGKEIDPVIINNALKKGEYGDCGAFLLDCMKVTPTAANVKYYCEQAKEESCKRRVLEMAEKIGERVCYNGEDWQAAVADFQSGLEEIEQDNEDDLITSASACTSWKTHYGRVKKDPEYALCKTGYVTLDSRLGGGMFKQGVYVVGARPGMGKTTLGVNIAENVAKRGKITLLISLEMSREQITAKRIARESGLNYTKLMGGGLKDSEEREADEVLNRLNERPFNMTDRSGMTVVDIGRLARRIKDLSVIVIDYLGIVKCAADSEMKPRYEQMTDISADLKALAKVLKVPIVVLCQLNRENTTTQGKEPQLQHLRDSGAIEQDADCVILLHRPEYYNQDRRKEGYQPPEHETIELDVAKNRHGTTGLVKMDWCGSSGKISELDTAHTEPRPVEIYDDIENLPF